MYSSSRSRVFLSWRLTKCWFSIGSRAHVRLTCWKQSRIVHKPVNASPGSKFIRVITFSSIQMFFAALFWVYGDYKSQNRKSNSYKTQINILHFSGLAQSGTEQPGQRATLLGWPKSLYYIWLESCPRTQQGKGWNPDSRINESMLSLLTTRPRPFLSIRMVWFRDQPSLKFAQISLLRGFRSLLSDKHPRLS